MEPYAPYPLDLVRDWFHRRRWWIRLALAVVLVPWFGHFAYTRMTTRPAKPFSNWNLDAGRAIPDPAVDHTKEMVAAMIALPVVPTLLSPTTAPAGMEWLDADAFEARRKGEKHAPQSTTAPASFMFSPAIALVGDWTPTTRYHLREIIKYLELPATQTALDQIASLSDKPFCVTFNPASGSPNGLAETRHVVKLLMARARYCLIERHDFDRALRDIEATLNIAAGVENNQTLICALVGIACRSLALSEMANWSDEFKLNRAQTRQIQDLIVRHRCDLGQLLSIAVRGEQSLSRSWLDEMYTGDGQGNGWFVPTYARPEVQRNSSLLALNLLSPCFADRRRAEGIVGGYWERQIAALRQPMNGVGLPPIHLPFGTRDRVWNPTLPCIEADPEASYTRVRVLLTRTNVYTEGAITALALAAYRNDRRQYPSDLASLVPEYLPELPKDPFADQPLRYRRDDKEGYCLYSVDANGRDDGGVLRDAEKNEELDFPIRHKRGAAWSEEWFLVPIENTASRTTDDQPR